MAPCMTASGEGERFDNRVLSVHRFINRSLVGRLVHYMLMLPGGTATMVAAAQPSPMVRQLSKNTMAVDADALLLKPSPDAAFPAYFLVAVEAGGYVRGLFLLAFYPILRMLSHEACVKAVAMVSFCGLRRDEAARIGRAVLPKLFSREAPHMHAMEALNALPKDVKVVAVSRTFPTVMVEAFLKEYVGFDAVAGRELKGGPRYLTGAMAELDMERLARVPKQAEKTLCSYYPKPVVFHDGRLAFTPTPAAALAMYIYFPLAILLAIVRIAIYVLLPWRVSSVVAGLTGVRVRVIGAVPSAGDRDAEGATKPHGGRLYACNHRTLLDPVGIACALKRPSFDSVYFLMNPRPEYVVQFLEPVNTESGKSSIEVANDVQHALASALGFEGTALTRKDKYLLLAGNEGVVKTK
nr:unnamed protein product [Digitaria exilis]